MCLANVKDLEFTCGTSLLKDDATIILSGCSFVSKSSNKSFAFVDGLIA